MSNGEAVAETGVGDEHPGYEVLDVGSDSLAVDRMGTIGLNQII